MDEQDTSLQQDPSTATTVVRAGTVVVRPEGTPPPLTQVPGSHRDSADDYAVCGKIGTGGMGVVYLARDRRLGRYVAIKRLNEKALADPILRARFLHEARAVAALNHAYIVHIYALGEDALGPYIVMEYVSGPGQTEVMPAEGVDHPPPKNVTLEQFINQRGPMTADEAIAMVLKIARTMVYAHSCGVIHRDLKPANILLDPSEEPKLVDFGLARIAPQEGRTQVAELTVPGEKLISLGYSAPELEQDASVSDVRADIYSLGAILYFLLTGRNPRYYREQDVPAFLREVMRRSLETVREQRYRTAQDFARALSEAASHGKTVAPTIKTTWRCKWCDAVNPISTKFCAECGWDGSERCTECGAETFVGQQYCPACGADCRMYEHVVSIIKLMNQAWEERRFERIATIAGRLHGFEPSGPTGRKLISDARKQVEEAENKVARRNRLAALIPNELKAENYERAKAFIEEFRLLNEDPLVYEEELQQIPSQILSRDLVRIRHCIRTRDWATARLLVGNLAVKYGNVPEYQDVRRTFLNHDRRVRRNRWAIACTALFFLYLLSVPWAAHMAGGGFGPVLSVLYAPAGWVSAVPGIHTLYAKYVALCDSGRRMSDYFPAAPGETAVAAHLPSLPGGADEQRQKFDVTLSEIAIRRQTQASALLMQYSQGLNELRRNAQTDGNYESVVAVDRALTEYAESNTLGAEHADDPESLITLKRRVALLREEQDVLVARQVISASKRYTAALDEARKGYTQRGEMEPAGVISAEIQRIRLLPAVAQAEALLEKVAASGSTAASALSVSGAALDPDAHDPDLAAVREGAEALRKELEKQDRQAQDALREWPNQYIAALKTLINFFQQEGNFNALEVAVVELSRFEEMNTLSPENVVDYPEGLRQTQNTFVERIRSITQHRDKAKLDAYKNYISGLELLKSNLTKEGRLEVAAAVNSELRVIQKSPGYLALITPAAPTAPAKVHSMPPIQIQE